MNFKNLFKDPKTTSAGIVALALTAFKCYAMATGKAPIDPNTITEAASVFSAGAGLLLAGDAKPAVSAPDPVAEHKAEVLSEVDKALTAAAQQAMTEAAAKLAPKEGV